MKNYGNLIKISFLLLGIGMIFSFGISSSVAANNSTIYVSDNGNDNWNGLNSTWTPNTLNGPKATVNHATCTVIWWYRLHCKWKYSESNIQIFKNMSIIGQNQQNTIITGEEKMLTQELEGYTEYKTKIKYRLIPYIW